MDTHDHPAPRTHKDANTVKVDSVDEILARSADPKKPSSGAIATALLSLQRQVLLINNNQRMLQNQNAKIAAGVDRCIDALFDKPDGAGGLQVGLGTAMESAYKKLEENEAAAKNYVMFSATAVEFLRAGLPKLIKQNDGVFPTEEQCAVEIDAIMEDFNRKGEEASANRAKLEAAANRHGSCAFCKSWCKKAGIIIPGQEQKVECEQEFVQLACARCMRINVTPVKPMDVGDARCEGCEAPLQREVTDENGIVYTLCQLRDLNVEAARQDLHEKGFPPEQILAAYPLHRSPIEKNIGGDPTIGTAEVPPGPTTPLIK